MQIGSLTLFAQERIFKIEFEGINRSKPTYLKRFLLSEEGAVFDSIKVKKDIQSIRNTQLFINVKVEKKSSEGGVILVFSLDEILTVFPSLSFGDVKGNRFVQVGLVDFHWLGKGNSLGGFYRHDGRNSFQLFHKNPYLNRSSWGYSTSLLKLSTTEPLFFPRNHQSLIDIFDYERVNYLYDNITFELLGSYEFRFGHNAQFGGAYIFERYQQKDSTDLNVPFYQALHKGAFKSVYHFQDLDYYLQYLQGFSQDFLAEFVFTIGEGEPFWKVLSISKYFQRIGKSGNLAFRLRLGLSQNTESPFVPFVLDSYVNIRGSGNRIARGTGEAVLNVEYRHSLYQPSWGAIQAVGFIDTGSWRFPTTDNGTFGFSNSTSFTGLGFRLYFAKAFNFILRADYGFNLKDCKDQGLVLGVGQYF